MFARHFSTRARLGLLCPPRLLQFLALVSLLTLHAPPSRATLTVADSGRWTPPRTWSGVAVHMALLPGFSETYHSKILWFYGLGHHEFYGGLWGWKSGDYNCGSYPESYLDSLHFNFPPDNAAIFCGSMSHLDGKFVSFGGTQQGTENGSRLVHTFDPATGEWAKIDSMSASRPYPRGARWYASSVVMDDGRIAIFSGHSYQHIECFGGRQSASVVPADSSLLRYGVGGGGVADSTIRTSSTLKWPGPREGHTAVLVGGDQVTFMFGGKDQFGRYNNEYWQLARAPNTFSADYDYAWTGPATGGPAARWEHSAIASEDDHAKMIVFGGEALNPEDLTNVVMSDVWRLWWDTNLPGWTWSQISINGTLPGPRWGHATFYDKPNRKMFLFGGRSATTGAPTDDSLRCLTFSSDFTTGTWQTFSTMGPSARFDHAMAYDPTWRVLTAQGAETDTVLAFMFGGSNNSSSNQELWQLRVRPEVKWQQITDLSGSAPPARSGHTLNALGGSHTLFVFGGSSSDSAVYIAHLDSLDEAERAWTTYSTNAAALTGHTAIFRPFAAFERVPEVYNPSASPGSRMTRLTNAPHLQEYYPQGFVARPDTIFFAGPDPLTYKYSVSGQSWTPFPVASSGFRGGSSVLYRPRKVMKCGSRDTDFDSVSVGTTKSIDLNNQTATWVSSADTMIHRVNFNLVLLPNGKVMAIGGTRFPTHPLGPVLQPEIWDPDNSGGIGAWFGKDTLASQLIPRDYHSSSLLLPDGRVMSASGNDTT